MAATFLKRRSKLSALYLSLLITLPASALEYTLEPQQIAPETYFIEGAREPFNSENGGAIANVSYIRDKERILVIDSGPSKRFGEQLVKLITQTFGQPPTDLIITHHHPDHALGNQAFSDARIWSLPETREMLQSEGNSFAEGLYAMVGDWMRGTEVVLPDQDAAEGPLFDDTDRFQLINLTGHTGADLLLLDQTTRTLFASDLIFYQRALATPHTPGLAVWRADIEALRSIDFDRVVPGHGPVATKSEALDQMSDYLDWLDSTLTEAAQSGMTMNELIMIDIPERFSSVAMSRYELTRTVSHLYPDYEARVFGGSITTK